MARLGVRWESGSGDTAFGRTEIILQSVVLHECESGVALRFPLQSKTPQIEERFRVSRSVLECASPLALWGVTALGKDLRAAQAAAYGAVECIQFDGAHFRRDIAAKAM